MLQRLLPEASVDEQEHARRLITCLRLMRDDVRAQRPGTVGLALPGAREELDQVGRTDLLVLADELLRWHLSADLEQDSWCDFGRPSLDLQTVWSRLESLRARGLDVPAVPHPGEPALEVARRVLAAARRCGAEPFWCAPWHARSVRVAAGPAAGLEAFGDVLEQADAHGWSWSVAAQALAGRVRCWLDQGAVRQARAELDDRLVLVGIDDALAWLYVWTSLCLGDLAAASEFARERVPWDGKLPAPLVELREHRPEWLRLLPGREAQGGRSPAVERLRSRAPFHACVFGVFVLRTDRELGRLVFDAAPGVVAQAQRNLERRDGAWTRAGEPEQRVLVQGQPVIQHGRADAGPRGALAGAGTRALALVPLIDLEGEAIGWLHVECEHHLLPTSARLAALAAAWRDAALAELPPLDRSGQRAAQARPPVVEEGSAVEADAEDPRGVRARALVQELGLKLNRRRALVFDAELTPTCEPAWEEGRALADWRDQPGGRRALRRALRTAAAVTYDAPDASLGLHAAAASGVVLPLTLRGRVRGLVAFESTRRGDFRDDLVERLQGQLERRAWSWSAAQFRAWHRERFGDDVHFDPDARAWRERMDDLLAIAGGKCAVAVIGPEGAGKQTLARWLAFEGAHPSRRIVRRRTGTDEVLELHVPALKDRRDEIPGLIRLLCERIGRREGLPAPRWSDAAVGLLWRQPWPGNIRELETFLARVVLAAGDAELTAAELEALAARARRPLLCRLPSRRPRPEDLAAALETTAHANGSWNKTRAALYLGWDPDTLTARLAGSARG